MLDKTYWELIMDGQEMTMKWIWNTKEWIDKYAIAIITIGTITILIGIAILWNQRKINKQLRQLLEERKKEEDKP